MPGASNVENGRTDYRSHPTPLRATSSAIAHFARLQETTSYNVRSHCVTQCFPCCFFLPCVRLRLNMRSHCVTQCFSCCVSRPCSALPCVRLRLNVRPALSSVHTFVTVTGAPEPQQLVGTSPATYKGGTVHGTPEREIRLCKVKETRRSNDATAYATPLPCIRSSRGKVEIVRCSVVLE